MAQTTLNLQEPVTMKGEKWEFSRYTQTLVEEQRGAINYLDAQDIVWNVPGSLIKKVLPNGDLLPFHGDTTVFTLSSEQVKEVEGFIETLETDLPFLATPLDRKQLHMTLHDLSNDPLLANVSDKMKDNQEKSANIFKRIREYLMTHPEDRYIKMVSNNIYPCLNISLLLGMAPATDKDFRRLINIYNLFDDVVYLNYWLRPHITLGYFLPRELNKGEIALLSKTLKKIGVPKVEITFDIMDLAYQHFYDMNDYRDMLRP